MTEAQRATLVRHRFDKAESTLAEINVLIQNGFYNNTVNRLYYGCFYAVTALLLQNGIQSKTHSGTKQLFGLHFVKTGLISLESGDFFTTIFDMRQTGDYEDFIVFELDEVEALVPPAYNLLNEIKELLVTP